MARRIFAVQLSCIRKLDLTHVGVGFAGNSLRIVISAADITGNSCLIIGTTHHQTPFHANVELHAVVPPS